MSTTVIEPPRAANEKPETHESRARRWFSEFIVIVAGVIAALGADSLWDAWQDRQSEQVYLQQLRSDIGENVRRLEAAIALETKQHEAGETAYRAVLGQQVITTDSAYAWMITRRG